MSRITPFHFTLYLFNQNLFDFAFFTAGNFYFILTHLVEVKKTEQEKNNRNSAVDKNNL
jgi:hypothetical protein